MRSFINKRPGQACVLSMQLKKPGRPPHQALRQRRLDVGFGQCAHKLADGQAVGGTQGMQQRHGVELRRGGGARVDPFGGSQSHTLCHAHNCMTCSQFDQLSACCMHL